MHARSCCRAVSVSPLIRSPRRAHVLQCWQIVCVELPLHAVRDRDGEEVSAKQQPQSADGSIRSSSRGTTHFFALCMSALCVSNCFAARSACLSSDARPCTPPTIVEPERQNQWQKGSNLLLSIALDLRTLLVVLPVHSAEGRNKGYRKEAHLLFALYAVVINAVTFAQEFLEECHLLGRTFREVERRA
jgi:hypothetical protein